MGKMKHTEILSTRMVLGGSIVMAAVLLSQRAWASRCKIRPLFKFKYRSEATLPSDLKNHLRRDIGYDYPCQPDRPDYRDRLQIEIRRFR